MPRYWRPAYGRHSALAEPAGLDQYAAAVARDGSGAAGERVVRVGVTGHRNLASEDVIEATVDQVLDRRLVGSVRAEVWSSLAEGADRLVARRVLARPESSLVAVLPLPVDDYERDFETTESRAEFHELLGRARRTDVVGADETGSRESAYERAGHAVVDGADVLFALWDGKPSRGQGGTAEVVEYALANDVEVEVVLVDRGEAS